MHVVEERKRKRKRERERERERERDFENSIQKREWIQYMISIKDARTYLKINKQV